MARLCLIWLLALCLPAQAVLAQQRWCCVAQAAQTQAIPAAYDAHQASHTLMGQPSHEPEHKQAHEGHTAPGNCGACMACCHIAIWPSLPGLGLPAPPVSHARSPASTVPASPALPGLERPPRLSA